MNRGNCEFSTSSRTSVVTVRWVGTAMNPLFGLTAHTASDLVLLGAPKLNSEYCLFGLLGSKKTSCEHVFRQS